MPLSRESESPGSPCTEEAWVAVWRPIEICLKDLRISKDFYFTSQQFGKQSFACSWLSCVLTGMGKKDIERHCNCFKSLCHTLPIAPASQNSAIATLPGPSFPYTSRTDCVPQLWSFLCGTTTYSDPQQKVHVDSVRHSPGMLGNQWNFSGIFPKEVSIF